MKKSKATITGKDLEVSYKKDKVIVKGNDLEIFDEWHSMNEVYSHRIMLFCALLKLNTDIAWKSKKHNDGSSYNGWFIAGLNLPSGTITYHIPENMWEQLSNIKELDTAPEWDGHTSGDVLKRLNSWLVILNQQEIEDATRNNWSFS